MNINNECKVILTENGAKYLNKYHLSKTLELHPIFENLDTTANVNEIFPTNYREGDILKLPLWELISKFGGYFEKYTDAAFLNNEIKFLEYEINR